MSWRIVAAILEIHNARGQLSDFRTFDRAVSDIIRRQGSLVRSRSPTREQTQSAVDQFQRAETRRTLRRGRSVASQFATLARWRPQTEGSERSRAGIAMFDAVRDHGLESRETQAARDNYARVLAQYDEQMRDERDRVSNAQSRMLAIKQYYRRMQQTNDRAANVYGNLADNRTLRALGDFADSVRRDLVAAHLAFTELRSMCAQICSSIDTVRNRLNAHSRTLDTAIRENQGYQRMSDNRYEPNPRDERAVRRMA